MSGTVRRAGDGVPLAGQRIQIWAHTTEGHERDPHSHGATLTDDNIVNDVAGSTIDEIVEEIRAGNTYVNVHTIANPAGEVRGQL